MRKCLAGSMVMMAGKCTGSKIGMRDEGLLIHEHISCMVFGLLGIGD